MCRVHSLMAFAAVEGLLDRYRGQFLPMLLQGRQLVVFCVSHMNGMRAIRYDEPVQRSARLRPFTEGDPRIEDEPEHESLHYMYLLRARLGTSSSSIIKWIDIGEKKIGMNLSIPEIEK